jgi:antitoxin CptB
VKFPNDRPPVNPGSQERINRLRWQCRRGMKELDQLLTRYLENSYSAASEDDKAAFQALLELSDPELVGYLLQRQEPGSEIIARGIDIVLGRNIA